MDEFEDLGQHAPSPAVAKNRMHEYLEAAER